MTNQKKWCPGVDLNYRHADFQSAALPLATRAQFIPYLKLPDLSNAI